MKVNDTEFHKALYFACCTGDDRVESTETGYRVYTEYGIAEYTICGTLEDGHGLDSETLDNEARNLVYTLAIELG